MVYHLNKTDNRLRQILQQAAVSCSPVPYRLGGVGLWSGLTGKVGSAWFGTCTGMRLHDTAALYLSEGIWRC